MHLAPYLYIPLYSVLFLHLISTVLSNAPISSAKYIVAKHANNCNFLRGPIPTLNWIRQVNCLAAYDVINCDVHFKMFRYNSAANYQPNGGRYLQVLSGKDLYKQTIVVSKDDTFPARFPNIFVDYPLGQMRVGDKL